MQTERVTEIAQRTDRSRLFTAASGWHDKPCGDIIDMHVYPGPGKHSIIASLSCPVPCANSAAFAKSLLTCMFTWGLPSVRHGGPHLNPPSPLKRRMFVLAMNAAALLTHAPIFATKQGQWDTFQFQCLEKHTAMQVCPITTSPSCCA